MSKWNQYTRQVCEQRLGRSIIKLERYDEFSREMRDGFDFIDYLALDLHENAIIAIQAGGLSDRTSHIKRIIELRDAARWLIGGGKIEVWSWRKIKVGLRPVIDLVTWTNTGFSVWSDFYDGKHLWPMQPLCLSPSDPVVIPYTVEQAERIMARLDPVPRERRSSRGAARKKATLKETKHGTETDGKNKNQFRLCGTSHLRGGAHHGGAGAQDDGS